MDDGATLAWIGLGANLGDRAATLRTAFDALAALPATRLLARSGLWASAPLDAGGPDYLNAVARLATRLSPHELLAMLLAIEAGAGRERPVPNAPRTLDLDLLMHGDAVLDSPVLGAAPSADARSCVRAAPARRARPGARRAGHRPDPRPPAAGRGAALPALARRGPVIAELARLPIPVQTVALLVLSNVFMTFAWYGHLKNLSTKPWWIAALVSWGIALFEYLLQVPANRIGYGTFTLAQLKIVQEVVTLAVFVPFAMLYMDQPIKLDYLWAALCLVGAVYFVFRS
jgi:2-amino-4-hydroxy-6-hydroxymethyldihydropteridine diphosphokinase